MLIADIPDDFFQNVFQRDQPLQSAVFIDHKREVIAFRQERIELILSRCCLWNEPRVTHHLVYIEAGKIALMRNDGAQQILGVQDANNLFLISAVERQAGMRAGERLHHQLAGVSVSVQHIDVLAVDHHLFDGHVF